jgi:glycerol-3-phosphate dehydrogenase
MICARTSQISQPLVLSGPSVALLLSNSMPCASVISKQLNDGAVQMFPYNLLKLLARSPSPLR